MYSLIIALIVTILVAIIVYKDSNGDKEEAAFGAIFVCAVIYLIVIGVGRLVYTDKHNLNVNETKPLYIASLSQSEGLSLHGSFILGCGSVDGQTYDYYVTQGMYKAGYKRIKLDAYNVYLKYSNSEKPQIKNYFERIVKKEFKSKWLWNRKESMTPWNHESYKEMYLIVPSATIKSIGKFNVE